MIRSKFARLLFASLVLTAASFPIAAHAEVAAHAESGSPASVTLGVAGGLTGADAKSSDTIQNTGLSADRKFGLGGAVMFDSPLAPMFSIGLGAIYLQRKFDIGNDTLRFERKVPTLFVPLEGRIWLGNLLYLGAGGFGAFRVGDQTDRIVTGNSASPTLSTGQRESFEYGLTASAAFTLPIVERTGFTFEARYLHGMKNSSKDGIYEEHIRDLVLTAGIRLSLN